MPKRRNATTVRAESESERLRRERDEALLRETANSEILRLISKSPGDLELVFRSILENATRICNANFGTLFRFDGENFYPAAQYACGLAQGASAERAVQARTGHRNGARLADKPGEPQRR